MDDIQNATNEVNETTATETTNTTTATEPSTDVEKLQAAIAALETAGTELCQDELATLKAKLFAAEEAAKQAAEAAVAIAEEAEQTFVEKYGSKIKDAGIYILLLLLLLKAFGVL